MQIDVFFQKNKKCFTRGEKDEVISEKAEGRESSPYFLPSKYEKRSPRKNFDHFCMRKNI